METRATERRKGADLTLPERKTIEAMRENGCSAEEIAKEVGVHYVTIYRELHRGETGDVNAEGVPVYNAELTPMGLAGRMNPEWTEWFMGYPIGWTELNASETR